MLLFDRPQPAARAHLQGGGDAVGASGCLIAGVAVDDGEAVRADLGAIDGQRRRLARVVGQSVVLGQRLALASSGRLEGAADTMQVEQLERPEGILQDVAATAAFPPPGLDGGRVQLIERAHGPPRASSRR
ncbi:MAG: hypothetical protein A2138_03690 [Deltaproteobacteria bacterium RBG_16_71_12]|nr:MAG: hypothetical protein A2138_03690 [Deltaproteobacteria bacterium RBG_16_71_12]